MDKTPNTRQEPVSGKELREILFSYETFSGLSDSAYEALAGIAERIFVPAGEQIVSSGMLAEWAYVVEVGRLRGIIAAPDHVITVDLGRGEFSALVTTLTQEPIIGDLFALRDSKIIRFRGSDLLQCMSAHPELIMAYSRYVMDMSKRIHGMGAQTTRPQAFALMPANEDTPIGEVTDGLFQALSDITGTGSLMDSRQLKDILGQEVTDEKEFEQARHRLIAWCETQESEGRFLLFVCDSKDTSWTRWCLQQTDRIIVVARAGATAEIGNIDRAFAGRVVAKSAVTVDLLLIYDGDPELSRGTGAWMKLKCRRRHHHVRLGNAADFKRAARRMSERAVGLVLGGGGARGLAHIGVLKALEEAGIPVDVIGGTSMGSVMAATYARGWSPERILKMAGEVFTDTRAVMDLDFPMVSMLGGHKLDKVLQSLFGDIDIADLWLPYFCISSNLSEGRMMVHDRGPLWLNVRASCSLPGIFPPVHTEGHLLVDGGIVNNVPVDIMGNQCKGGNERIANIFQILMWSTTLSSKQYLQQLLESGRVDLFLTPPVQEFQLLGFDAYEKLYEIGYEYTSKQLAGWDCLQQVKAGSRCNG
jgi:NTE family protein/lysophospholipid hydrolase